MSAPPFIIIDAPHMYAGAVVHSGLVTRAAPILSWSVGKPWEHLTRWAYRKGYTVIQYGREKNDG